MSDGSSDLFYNVQFSREFSINGQSNIINEMRINENLVNESLSDETPDTTTHIHQEWDEDKICAFNICPIITGVFASLVATIGIYIVVQYL
jgi:hypothetical protein